MTSELKHRNDIALIFNHIEEHLPLDCIGVIFEYIEISRLVSLRDVSEPFCATTARVFASVHLPVVLYIENYSDARRVHEAHRLYIELRGCVDAGVRARTFTTSPNHQQLHNELFKVAAQHGNVKLLALTLRSFPDIDANRSLALHEAAKRGHDAAVDYLLGVPAINVNMLAKRSNTALSLAIQSGHLFVVRRLLKDPRIRLGLLHKRNETVLHIAAHEGSADIVNAVLSHADAHTLINAPESWRKTPLFVSAIEGNFEAVNSLLLRGVGIDVNAVNRRGDTALVACLRRGHIEIAARLMLDPRTNFHDLGIDVLNELETWNVHDVDISHVVSFLLDYKLIDVGCRSDGQNTPLHFAAEFGNETLARELLAEETIDVNAVNAHGHTPLVVSLREVHIETAGRLMLDPRNNYRGLGINIVDDLERDNHYYRIDISPVVAFLLDHGVIDEQCRSMKQNTPLHFAAQFNNLKLARALLEVKGIDVNARNSEGYTPLFLAQTSSFKREVYDVLIKHKGVDVSIPNKRGESPLHDALFRDEHALRALLQHSTVQVNAIQARDGFTPLHVAIDWQMYEAMRLLVLDPRVRVNKRDQSGQTPLHACVQRYDPKCLRLLLRRSDVDLNRKDPKGRTALHVAAASGNVQAVEDLLRVDGARADMVDFAGDTAMHLAARAPTYDVDLNRRNTKGRTALHVAAASCHAQAVEDLLGVDGARADMVDIAGDTAVHLAARAPTYAKSRRVNFKKVSEKLIRKYEGLLLMRNNFGLRPLDIARASGNSDVISVLIKARAQRKSRQASAQGDEELAAVE